MGKNIKNIEDKELFLLFTEHEQESAFDELFRRYYSMLCLYSSKIVKNIQVSEDLIQDLFVKLWEQRSSIKIKNSVKGYLYRSAHNTSLNYLRSQKNQRTSIHEVLDHETNPEGYFHDVLEEMELEQQIITAVDKLPKLSGKIFKLNRFEGHKYKEIAKELEISIKTVEAHISKSLKTLSATLIEYFPIIVCFTSSIISISLK